LLTQATGLVENFFGARLEVGSIAALGFARRLSTFVVSLVALNVSRAVFPSLSRFIAERRTDEARELFSRLSRQFMIGFIPISIAFVYFNRDIVSVVYMRGAFDAAAVSRTAAALAFYAVGGAVLAMMPLCIRACYAFSDTVTPLVASGGVLLAAAVLSYVLTPLLGVGGIALGMSTATAVGVGAMWRVLARRFGGLHLAPMVQVSGLALVCGLLALLPVALLSGAERGPGIGALAFGLSLYFVAYAGLAWVAMRKEFQGLLVLLRGSP
jgi:putative peptidoglycan lipid II flippase